MTFDNKDKKNSPPGYEQDEQISISRQVGVDGKSKYTINGHLAQQQHVTSLFQSVQLNISNPHFLIMQGRILQVLNMKPVEVLSMIEEAAGTRMFEEKKEKAVKTMAKKESKLNEINSVGRFSFCILHGLTNGQLLAEIIEPKIAFHKEEKRLYLEYCQRTKQAEQLQYLNIAHDYLQYQVSTFISVTVQYLTSVISGKLKAPWKLKLRSRRTLTKE